MYKYESSVLEFSLHVYLWPDFGKQTEVTQLVLRNTDFKFDTLELVKAWGSCLTNKH